MRNPPIPRFYIKKKKKKKIFFIIYILKIAFSLNLFI